MGTHPIFESDFDCLTDTDRIMGLEIKRPERCAATSPMARVVLASTERVVTGEVEVLLVVSTTTESTSTSTIPVTSVKSVCATSTCCATPNTATRSTWTSSGLSSPKRSELPPPRTPPLPSDRCYQARFLQGPRQGTTPRPTRHRQGPILLPLR